MSRLRFVFATHEAEAVVILQRLAPEGTKQIRQDAVRLPRSVAAHFAFREHSRRGHRLGRHRNLGGNHPANVRSDANGREFFVLL